MNRAVSWPASNPDNRPVPDAAALPDVVVWARARSRYDDWDQETLLALTEDVLLRNTKAAKARLPHRVRPDRAGAIRLGVFGVLMIASLIGPPVFTSGRYWGTTREYNPSVAYPAASLSSLLAVLLMSVLFVQWRRQRPPRVRDGLAVKLGYLYLIFGAFTLFVAVAAQDTFRAPAGPYLVAIALGPLVAVATLVYQYRSLRNPLRNAFESDRIPLHRIHPDDQLLLLEERAEALRVLERRGFLEGITAVELAGRPLGQLHRPLGAENRGIDE